MVDHHRIAGPGQQGQEQDKAVLRALRNQDLCRLSWYAMMGIAIRDGLTQVHNASRLVANRRQISRKLGKGLVIGGMNLLRRWQGGDRKVDFRGSRQVQWSCRKVTRQARNASR